MSFSGSYPKSDVTILLKPTTMAFTSVEEKERLIQSGTRHYSEMLSPETVPGEAYMDLYEEALDRNAGRLHGDVCVLADLLIKQIGRRITLVSLARAGTPVGVLLQRQLRKRGVDTAHYSVSIVRGRGIDMVAMERIVEERDARSIVFVDGWTGKGAIAEELRKSLGNTQIAPMLAVIADPAGRANAAATLDDYVIPSGILNGIVSGLISRSVLNDDLVGPGDFHACLHQTHLEKHDRSMDFIRRIEASTPVRVGAPWTPQTTVVARRESIQAVHEIMKMHGVTDMNRVKPGIAEATRAILRRVPDAVHLRDKTDIDTKHIVQLAEEAGIPIHPLSPDCPYRAITVIRTLGE